MLNSTRKAFTLLELIVVVVVLGIVALVAVPTFSAIINASASSVAEQSAGSVARSANAIAALKGEATSLANLDTARFEYTGSGVAFGVVPLFPGYTVTVNSGEACVFIANGIAVASSDAC